MTIIFPALLFVIFIACVAVLYTEGMWGNAILLFNIVMAALLAVNYWEPLATWLDDWQPSYTYVWDFLSLWAVFALSMIILRAATDSLSRVKVRFLKIADRIGSVFFAAWIGWVLVCFTTMTLHTAPLARKFMFGGFDPEKREKFLGMAPDRMWLGFAQKMSLGAFCRAGTQAGKNEETVFDPAGQFMPKYATRRAKLEAHMKSSHTLRVR
jgi:uncharacterized membrane protein required for colicin V production